MQEKSPEKIQALLQKDGSWLCDGMTVPPCNALTAMLYLFREHPNPDVKEFAFWEVADIFWNDEREEPLMARHPWAERVIHECVNNQYVAVGGAAGSGKSWTMAAYSIVSWACAPSETIVIMTSTTLSAARSRIYGCFVKLLDATEGLPIRLRDSIGSAAYVTPDGTLLESVGVRLIAAEKRNTRDALGRLIGLHAPRVILVADELSELSIAIVEAAISNLARNPFFQMIGMSNPNSRFDSFGEFSCPKDGWDSVDTVNDYEWTTKYGGKYIRLDAERSPNLEYDFLKYPYLPSMEDIEKAKDSMGPSSRGYYRMYRAIFATNDDLDSIYSEAELHRSGGLSSVSLAKTEKVAALDPSFTNGGDATVIVFGEVGYDDTGQHVIQPTEVLQLNDDVTDKATPRSFQIAKLVKEACVRRKVEPHNFAMDATGAGSPLADVIASEWSPDILRVQFSGKASDRAVSASKRTPANQLYTNRVSELWFVSKELLRCRQLRGIPMEVAKDMCGRTFDTVKSEHGLRIRVEPKTDFKARLGHSPDSADAMFVLVELARDRFGLLAMEPVKDDDGMAVLRRHRTVRSLDAVAATLHAHLID